MQKTVRRLSEAQSDWLERAALGASAMCVVHCLALPLLLAALPVLSSVLNIPETAHLWILAFATPTSGLALITGRAGHRATYPLLLGACGLALLAAGALASGETAAETLLTVGGSLLLAGAHLANWRLRHRLAAVGGRCLACGPIERDQR